MEVDFAERHTGLPLFKRTCVETVETIVCNTYSERELDSQELNLLCNLENPTYFQLLCNPEALQSEAALEKLLCIYSISASDALRESIAGVFQKRVSDASSLASNNWYPRASLLIRCLYLLGSDLKLLQEACGYGHVQPTNWMSEVVALEASVHDLGFQIRTPAENALLRSQLSAIVALYHRALCENRHFREALVANSDELVLLCLAMLQLALTSNCDIQILKHTMTQLFLRLASSEETARHFFNRNLIGRMFCLAQGDEHRVVYALKFMHEALPTSNALLCRLLQSCIVQLIFEKLLLVEVSTLFPGETCESLIQDLNFDRLWVLISAIRDFLLRTQGPTDVKVECAEPEPEQEPEPETAPSFRLQHAYFGLLLSKVLVDGQIRYLLIDVDSSVTQEQIEENGLAFLRFVSDFGTLHSSIVDRFVIGFFKLKRCIRQIEKDWLINATDVGRSLNVNEDVEILPFSHKEQKVDVRPESGSESRSGSESESGAPAYNYNDDGDEDEDLEDLPIVGSQ